MGNITHPSERPARAGDEDDFPRRVQVWIRWFEGGVEVPVHGLCELEGFGESILVDGSHGGVERR